MPRRYQPFHHRMRRPLAILLVAGLVGSVIAGVVFTVAGVLTGP